MSGDSLRRHLSAPGMLRAAHGCLRRVPDPPRSRGIALSGCLMPGPAVFPLKIPSLLRIRRAGARRL